MGLFSFLNKNKPESTSGAGEFYSRAEEESQVARGRIRRRPGKSANQPVDPVLPEKKRARRRLVGAVALVLAVIIGLPMILDSEPKPLTDDISIQIPSKDKPAPTNAVISPVPPAVSVPLAESLGQREQVIQMPNAGVGTAATSAKAATAELPIAAQPADHAAESSAKGKSKEDVRQTEPAHAAESVKMQVPQDFAETADAKPARARQHELKKHDEARAEAILEGKDTGPGNLKSDKTPAKFSVQVAALASQEKVTELQGKLGDAGIKSYTQKVPTASGLRIRVRIGPFSSKEEADGARVKLSKLGLNGTLVPS